MSFELVEDQEVQITIRYEHSQMVEVSTNSPFIAHFLRKVRLSQAQHTWISYAHDLKVFFRTVALPLEQIDRQACLTFMERQDQLGLSSLTINRRLAAISSLFAELTLLAPQTFPTNPVTPLLRSRQVRRPSRSLYRKQPARLPEVLTEEELHALFAVLPCWRDRTLVLLMWISCLRISEALALRFQDVECSKLRLQVACGKGGHPRTVYMDRYTFAALNTYLDEERGELFPEVEELFVAFKGVARGRPLSVNALQHSLDYYAAKCGIGLHAHLLRHTGITQLVQQGMSEPAIRKLVGHRHAQSLEPYLHLADRFVQAEFEQAQAALQPLDWLPSPEPKGGNKA